MAKYLESLWAKYMPLTDPAGCIMQLSVSVIFASSVACNRSNSVRFSVWSGTEG